MRVFGFEYSRFEGLLTPWQWLDGWLCRRFGHPQRRYYEIGVAHSAEICARCCVVVKGEVHRGAILG